VIASLLVGQGVIASLLVGQGVIAALHVGQGVIASLLVGQSGPADIISRVPRTGRRFRSLSTPNATTPDSQSVPTIKFQFRWELGVVLLGIDPAVRDGTRARRRSTEDERSGRYHLAGGANGRRFSSLSTPQPPTPNSQ
jgi:hypothetical protein